MTVEQEVANLTTSVDQLTDAVNVKKQTLDASVADSESARDQSQGYRDEARTARDESQSHANDALGYSQDAASAVAYQDLTSIAETKSETAVDVFVYDTSKDSDGGAWRHRTQHTSWYNEPLNTATRGGRREFPAVAVIVAENDKVTIYDGDDPALPMWMVFVSNGANDTQNMLNRGQNGVSAVSALNGDCSVAAKMENNHSGGLRRIRFLADTSYYHYESNAQGGIYKGQIADRNSYKGFTGAANVAPLIIDAHTNDVAMTVLPDAPFDQATGLPVPTIAVATDGGVSVIKDDGTVVDITSGFGAEMDYYHISFDDQNRLHFTNRLDATYPVVFNAVPSSDVSVSTADVVYGITGSGFTPNTGIYLPSNVGEIDSYLPIAAAGVNGLFPLSTDFSSPPKSMQATITSTHNTGWMPGAIKGAFLSDTNDTDLVGSINFSSTFSSWTGDDPDEFSVIGTEDTNNYVAKVASGARIVSDGSLFGLQVIVFNHLTTGKQYIIKFVKSGHVSGEIRFGTSGNLNTIIGSDANGTFYGFIDPATNGELQIYRDNTAGSTDYVLESVEVFEVEQDRSVNNNGLIVNGTVTREPVAPGADLVAYSGFASSNYLEQPYNPDLDFGTGDFCVMGWVSSEVTGSQNIAIVRQDEDTTGNGLGSSPSFYVAIKDSGVIFDLNGAKYNGAIIQGTGWRFVTGRRENGVAELYIDGVLQSSGSSNANLDNPTGTIRLGTRTLNGALEGRYTGFLALWRISATAPTPEQIKRIYEDEKVLFQENAQATLYGTSDAVTALAHDEVTDLLHVGTSDGRSVFQGLRRVDNTTDAVTTAISANNDMVVDQ